MSNVISFRPSPLSPFLGKWALDPLSVSRNKIVRLTLRPDGLKRLWDCDSIEERTQLLAAEPDLANRYESLLRFVRVGHLVVTPQSLAWSYGEISSIPAHATACPVLKVTAEGRKAIVHTVDTRPEGHGQPIRYVFRMSKQWLLVSERYAGRRDQLFPRSPVHRYYLQPETPPLPVPL